jgi:hypothetical protein
MSRPATIDDTAALGDEAGGRGIALQVGHRVPEAVSALVTRITDEQRGLHVLVHTSWGATTREWNKVVCMSRTLPRVNTCPALGIKGAGEKREGPLNFCSFSRTHNHHFKVYAALFLVQYPPALEAANERTATIAPQTSVTHCASLGLRVVCSIQEHRGHFSPGIEPEISLIEPVEGWYSGYSRAGGEARVDSGGGQLIPGMGRFPRWRIGLTSPASELIAAPIARCHPCFAKPRGRHSRPQPRSRGIP